MAKTSKKDLKELIVTLERQGWRLRRNKHITFYPPNKAYAPVTIPVSGGGGRGRANAIAQLRRAGARI